MSKWKRRSYGKQRKLNITRLIARDGASCWLCEQPLDRRIRHRNDPLYVTFDHIVPRSAGGLTTFANLRLAHQLCNNERGSDPLVDEGAAV